MIKSPEIIAITLNKVLSDDRDDQFGYIWERYRIRLLYYITAVMHCGREDGEDMLQEIMIKVFNNLDRYIAGTSFNAWIYTITRNHCLDFMRKKKSKPENDEYCEGNGTAPDVFDEVCNSELHHAIRTCLEKMKGEDREMVYLRHFEGLRYRSIGVILGLNVNSVKTRMKVVEARLRQDLKEWV
jgi:RNA polymerase sigma factor (sigma-70 family)